MKAHRCPSCGASLKGNENVCPYCNTSYKTDETKISIEIIPPKIDNTKTDHPILCTYYIHTTKIIRAK